MSDPARGAEAEDAYGFPAGLWRWLQRHPPPALHRLTRFRSPLRGPWLTSVFGLVLLVALPFVIITGLLSYIAYAPQLGQAIPGDVGWLRLPAFTWPTRPSWLYRLTQGLHVGLGLVIIPVVLAKLWSVIPRLFVWPPARSIAQVLERLSVLMLVGGILFQIVTGVLNIQYDYIFGFSFYTGHYFGAWVFIAGFLLHIVVKIPHMVTGLRSIPMREVLGTNVADTRAQPCDPDGLVSVNPGEATLSRRGALGLVGAGVLLIGVLTVGQTLGGFTRKAALLLPRGRVVSPGDFPVNKTAAAAGITAEAIGPDWRLVLRGGPAKVVLDRATLAGLPQRTARLPLACVEGWSAVRTWSGVPLAELALLAGVPAARSARVTSLQRGGAFGETKLAANQIADPMRCWRCGSTGRICRWIMATRPASSFPHCPVCTTRNGSLASNSTRGEMFDIATRFKNSYGSGPLHLLAMVSGFALLGYIVATARPSALWNQATWWQSIAVWFVAAVVAHDLLLYPLYALADRILARLVGRRDVSAPRRRPELPVRNYIRIPALAAGLTLLVFLPGIIRQGAPTYLDATGQTQEPFLGRWLLLTAVAFGISAAAYAIRLVVAHVRRRRAGCSRVDAIDEE